MSVLFTRLLAPLIKPSLAMRLMKCHSVFGIKDLIHQEKPDHFTIKMVTSQEHGMAVDLIKRYYLPEHVLVRARGMDLANDRAVDEYLVNVMKQGNALYASTDDGAVAGICVGFACSPIDPKNLRNYAFYRQDPNTKEFFYFTAKLQETPNLWEVFKQPKVFEIKMLAVLPEYRRQGLGVMLTEKARYQAHDQGYKVIRMDCINPYDYKIAEHCSLQCIVKFPLHKLRGARAPFIKRTSEYNSCVRVYVDFRSHIDAELDRNAIRQKQADLESLIE